MTPPGNGYTPIADYGLIGDRHSAALVSKSGSIDWCPMPRFDSPSIFGAILDSEKGGRFAITPTGSFTSSIRSTTSVVLDGSTFNIT
jgi:GH15 family glucan-1,4-alpha-glucosidase